MNEDIVDECMNNTIDETTPLFADKPVIIEGDQMLF